MYKRQIYKYLGLTVGCIQQNMEPARRREQYACDITYGTNNEFGFDYLRDNMAVRPEYRVQRGFAYAIVDEVDSVLIDEARTPLIISGPVDDRGDDLFDEMKPLVERVVRSQQQWATTALSDAEKLLDDKEKEWDAGQMLLKVQRAAPKHKRFIKLLSERPELKKLITRVELEYLRDKRMHELDEDLYYTIDEKSRNADLLEEARKLMSPSDPDRFTVPDLTAQLSELEGRDEFSGEQKIGERDRLYQAYGVANNRNHAVQALLKAYALFDKDVEYVVQDGKVIIVDEFTGRLMPGRRYSDGLHQAIEAKESVKVEGETQTLATITLQNFFRMYAKLAGMTGTAETESREFWEIYKLDVAVIPTHKQVCRADMDDSLADRVEDRPGGLDVGGLAANHDRQRAVHGPLLAAADRRVEHPDASRATGRGQCPRRVRAYCAHVDVEQPGCRVREHPVVAPRDRLHVR